MSKKVYRTSNLQQLIDLNEDLTNFKLKFTLNSKNGQEFAMAIADQHTIDNNPNEIEFKKVKNTISGTITSDKNVFQNHFLILKSIDENEAEVEVIINKKEIPPNEEEMENQRQLEIQRNNQRENQRQLEMQRNNQRENEREIQRGEFQESKREQENYTKDEVESTTWVDIKLIIIILICILIGIFIYNVVSKKSGISTNLNEILPNKVEMPSLPQTDMGFNQNLFGKLNRSIPI